MAKYLSEEIDTVKGRVSDLHSLTITGMMVLFIGFAAMFGTLATLVISHFDSDITVQAEESN